MTSLLQWTSGNTLITDRNNAYNRAVGAAEAATENALSHVTRDFVNQSFDPANVGHYRNLIPTNDWAAEYEFSDGAGGIDRVWVESSATKVFTNLASQFSGLYGWVYVCSVRANARLRPSLYPEFAVAVRQDFQLASIPIFQFGIYYAMDLEMTPSDEMIVTGKVHSNADIYASPSYRLEFVDAVGAVGKIYHSRHPDDPFFSSGMLPIYDSLHQEKVSSLTLPMGSNNSPENVRQILAPRPPGEEPTSVMGRQRYYNKADVLVTATSTSWVTEFNVTGDGIFGLPTTNFWSGTNQTFLKTNSFYDYRENKTVLSIDIDVGDFSSWATANPLGRPLKSIYVDDQRPVSGNELAAVRVTNGRWLPDNGLTVATARPLYVKGDFNAPNLGSADTSQTKPASLVGDSITILSIGWDDADTATTSLSQREADDTTVNAALLGGIVQTTSVGAAKYYSGGIENFPRLLEDWLGHTFTCNGSMVALFPSRYATNFWNSPGNYYNPPTRRWAFDVNFLDKNKLPPLTPKVQKLVRGQWQVIAANSPN